MKQEDWMADIGKACDELGYGVTDLRPGDVEMIRLHKGGEVRVRIESYLLTGDLIRQVLAPVKRTNE